MSKSALSAFKFASSIRELRIHLCQQSSASSGVRQFIEKHYSSLKQLNQTTPILIREANGTQPQLYARYDFGLEKHLPLANLNEEQVWKAVEKLTK